MDQQPLMKGEGDRRSRSALHALMIATIIVCCVTLVTVIVFGAALVGRDDHHHHLSDEKKEKLSRAMPLPSAYLIPDDVRTPPKNQAHRGTCYIFSTMGILEASYRRYGLKKGYLKENQYVKFSEQAYGLGLIKYCEEHKDDPHCLGGPPTNSTEDGQPEWLYYMQDGMMKYVLPDALCPYQPENEGQFICPGLDDAVKKNPISFRVKNIETVYSIDSIKRLLVKHAFPLTFSHVVLDATYLAPCDDPDVYTYGSEQCDKCYYPCTTSSNGCCAKLVFPGYTADGVFSTFGEPIVGGGHAMVIVGWNDEMAVETGVPGQSTERAIGGFIIKNSWDTTVGHSAEYWAQKHSLLDETAICPNEGSYEAWLPVNTTCMMELHNPEQCGTVKRHVIDRWVFAPTVLKCNENTQKYHREWMYGWTGCRDDRRYLVAGDPTTGYSTPDFVVPKNTVGLRRFRIIEFDPTDPTLDPVVIETNATSWYGFERLLQPVEVVGNTDHCGYYFMPYDTFLKSNIVNPNYGTDTPAFSYMDIEWDKSSYADGSSDSKYDLIKESTHTYAPPKFTSSLDFDKKF